MSSVYHKYFNPDAIKLAFYRVQCWSDKMIKDQVGIRAFWSQLYKNCEQLSQHIILIVANCSGIVENYN